MANKLTKTISPTSIDGKQFSRIVEFEGISYLSLSLEYAEIIWKIYLLDSNGDVIDHPDVIQGRRLTTTVSNQFRVTQQGITITTDFIKSFTPQNQGELDIDYEYRIAAIYKTMFDAGIPEFDFYWQTILTNPLPTVLDQSITVIDGLKGYDKQPNRGRNGTI